MQASDFSPFIYFFLITKTPTHTPYSSRVCVSTGPEMGESLTEEPDDKDLNIEQNIAYTIHSKLVTYVLYLLKIISLHYPTPPPPPLLLHPTTIMIHKHIHDHHYSEPASVNMTTPADVSGADVSGDENSNHTYIIHAPQPNHWSNLH